MRTMNKSTWATIVYQWRVSDPGLTQVEAAEVVGVNERTLRRWEAGEICPSARKMRRYLRMMGVTPRASMEG